MIHFGHYEGHIWFYGIKTRRFSFGLAVFHDEFRMPFAA